MPPRIRPPSLTPDALQTFQNLQKSMLASTAEVFEGFATVEYLDAAASAWLAAGQAAEGCFVATIGYSATMLAGSVSLVAERDAIAPYLRSLGCEELSEAEVSDACGEVTNMLIGRLKNKSRDGDFMLQVGTPTTMIATRIRMAPSDVATSSIYVVRFAGGNAYVRLDTAFQPGFARAVSREEPAAAAREGEGLFF